MPPGRGVARRTKDVSTMGSPHPLPIMDDLLYESDTRSGTAPTETLSVLPFPVYSLPHEMWGIFVFPEPPPKRNPLFPWRRNFYV